MYVNITTYMNKINISHVINRLGIIDRLINIHRSIINELIQKRLDIEKQIKTSSFII